MRGFQAKLDVIGNNIANVNTAGFKGSRVTFKDILSQTTAGVSAPTDTSGGVNAKQIGLGVAIAGIDVVHTPGSAMTTNNPLDLRIDGDGYFAVKQNDAQQVPFLTRAGNFSLDSLNRLVNADGLFVTDTAGGIITLPAGTEAFTIAANGQVIAKLTDGTTSATQSIGLARVPNPAGLEKIGGNLYRLSPNAVADITAGAGTLNIPGQNGAGQLVAGALEMSNVDLTSEFTEMIVAQRGFQANAKIITTSDEVLQEVVGLKR
jgi:flagellar hook protein FlgE